MRFGGKYGVMLRKLLSICAGFAALIASFGAVAQDFSPDPDYQACIDRIEANIDAGRKAALRWVTDGGGAPALHCVAVADIAAGFPRLAAGKLDSLAEKSRLIDALVSARLYVQAAQAWTQGGETERALASLREAYRMAPAAEEVNLLAAPIYAEAGRWGLVKKSLDDAERDTPLSSAALVLRARAKMVLSDPEAAARDLQKALNEDPENIDGLILRGELAQAGYALEISAP